MKDFNSNNVKQFEIKLCKVIAERIEKKPHGTK